MMTTLAQSASMPHFPSGPALERWLFEEPIPTMLVLVGLGIIGAYVLRQNGRGRQMGWALVAAAVLSTAVWSLAQLVTTDREVLREGTNAFVEAMATGDRNGARSLLDKDAFLVAAGAEYGNDGDDIADVAPQAARYVDTYNLRTVSSTMDGTNTGRTRFDITLGINGSPQLMGWELAWRRVGGSWRIVRAECMTINNKPPQNRFRWYLPSLR